MAGSLNKVQLIGNLGADPEIRSFPNGGRMCNLRLATSETWKDRNTGERRERTQWHTIAIFSDHLVRICEQYLRKGSKIYIEGQLEHRKWQDSEGKDRWSTEVALRPYRGELQMLDSRNGGGRGEGHDQSRGTPPERRDGYSEAPRRPTDQGRSSSRSPGYAAQAPLDPGDAYVPGWTPHDPGYGGYRPDHDDDVPF